MCMDVCSFRAIQIRKQNPYIFIQISVSAFFIFPSSAMAILWGLWSDYKSRSGIFFYFALLLFRFVLFAESDIFSLRVLVGFLCVSFRSVARPFLRCLSKAKLGANEYLWPSGGNPIKIPLNAIILHGIRIRNGWYQCIHSQCLCAALYLHASIFQPETYAQKCKKKRNARLKPNDTKEHHRTAYQMMRRQHHLGRKRRIKSERLPYFENTLRAYYTNWAFSLVFSSYTVITERIIKSFIPCTPKIDLSTWHKDWIAWNSMILI